MTVIYDNPPCAYPGCEQEEVRKTDADDYHQEMTFIGAPLEFDGEPVCGEHWLKRYVEERGSSELVRS